MDFYIRADAGPAVGGGHLTRCLALAECLRGRGARVTFLCATLADRFRAALSDAEFAVTDLSLGGQPPRGPREDAEASRWALAGRRSNARWLIVDHYALGAEWESSVGAAVTGLMAIDDLANRPHACDVLLDQTYGADEARYRGLVPDRCRELLGSRYVLLRPEFAQARSRSRADAPRSARPRMHLFFGTADTHGNAPRFTRLLLENFSDLELRVVSASPPPPTVESLMSRGDDRVSWCGEVADMAAHMSACDLALGAPGMATWERACVGLPAAYVTVADNQVPIVRRLAADGFCVYLGSDTELADGAFVAGVAGFLADGARLAAMRATGLAAIDGLGAERVAALLAEQIGA